MRFVVLTRPGSYRMAFHCAGITLALVALAVGAGQASGITAAARAGPVASALPPALALSTGKTFYVSPRGSDSNPGSLRQPWRTVQKALATLKPGQRALVRAGVYREELYMRRSGTAAKPITVRAYPDERPVLRAPSGPDNTYAIRISGSYFRLRGFTLAGAYGTSSANVYVLGSGSHIEIRRNVIRSSQDQGIFTEETTSSVHIVDNRVYDNGLPHSPGQHQSHGMYLEGSDHFVANNTVYNHPFGFGIQIYPENTGTMVVNNTVVANGLSGIVIGGAAGVSNITIRNNIFAFNGRWGIAHDRENPSASVADHNVLHGNQRGAIQPEFAGTDFSGGNIQGDPLFEDLAGRDFHLRTRSAALDKALADYSTALDADGRRRPQGAAPDVGAFERTLSRRG
jgi:hypothetical protein